MPSAPIGFVLVAHAAATWAMTGVIWFVQVVHYPLMGRLGTTDLGTVGGVLGTVVGAAGAAGSAGLSGFTAYHAAHARLTSLVVGPLMLVEAVAAVWIVLERPSPSAWLGVVLLMVVWGATFFVAVPRHNLLSSGFDAAVIDSLVTTNWLRTGAWTVRALLAAWWLLGIAPRS